jgi:hypothetical protein
MQSTHFIGGLACNAARPPNMSMITSSLVNRIPSVQKGGSCTGAAELFSTDDDSDDCDTVLVLSPPASAVDCGVLPRELQLDDLFPMLQYYLLNLFEMNKMIIII